MSHDGLVDRLSEFLDGSLDEADRRAMEAHLKDCVSCRLCLKELRALQQDARSLPSYEAPEELWRHVRSRIRGRRSTFWTSKASAWLAIAAGLLVSFGLWLASGGIFNQTPGNQPENQEELVMMVTEELRAAESHYQRAIDGLEQIVAQNEGVLPPELSAVLDENLELIEGAIAESRRATVVAPDSRVAQDSLLAALRRKVSLLQNTILLINEVRKGEGESALDLIEEMRQTNPSSDPI